MRLWEHRPSTMSAPSVLRWRSASAHDGVGGGTARARILCSPLIVASLLFGVPVALGIVVSVVRLLGVRYPDLGWATTVNSDAEELYLGHTLYQNPAHGYTGQIYTPLFPAVVSLFDRLYLWNGWALLVVIGASVSLAVLAARLAYTRASPVPRAVAVLGAAGVGGIAYWCVSSVPLALLDEARADQMAWALALFGLVAVADFGPAPSSRRVVVAVLLLSAALWTKQTTVAVVASAVAWVVVLGALSVLKRTAAVLFVGLLCGMNLVLLAVLNILTQGWEFYINFEMATLQAVEKSYGTCIKLALQSVAVAGAFVVVTWLVSVLGAATRRRARRAPSGTSAAAALRRILLAEDPTGRRALLLAIYVVVGFVLAVYFMRKQGTETNQMIGVTWGLGLLAAAGWRVAQGHPASAATVGGCVALFFVLTQLGPIDEMAAGAEVRVPALEEAAQWPPVPAELLSWASDHTLYTPLYADLNVPQGGPLYPNYYNFADLLASGSQPLYLVHALLDRRFDGVAYFSLEGDRYTSAEGKWEENYLWKLDEVIAARYAPEPGMPQGVLGRRPGPEQASWMRYCFGPFTAGGVSFRIHRGGGFWCSFSPDSLQLVRAPVPFSEVVTTQPVSVHGTIALSLEGATATQVELVLGGGSRGSWVAHLVSTPSKSGEVLVSTQTGATLLGSVRVRASKLPGGRLGLRLGVTPTSSPQGPPVSTGPGAVSLTAPAAKAPFAVIASDGATLDLHATSLQH